MDNGYPKSSIERVKIKSKPPEWKEQIRASEYFLVLATPKLFAENGITDQAEFAKVLRKPFRVLLQKGTEIPEGFFNGVEDIQIETFELGNKESIFQAFENVMGEDAFARFMKKELTIIGEKF